MTQPDRYDSLRRREHSTLGDSARRYRRDTDAFTAGVQYAFDKLLGQFHGTPSHIVRIDSLTSTAANILGDVHEGTL